MIALVAIAVVAFVVTNLDDLVALTAFCGHERYRLREVLSGQYLGFGLMVAVSLLGGQAVATFHTEHLRLLGILPLVVGILWLVRTRTRFETEAGRPSVRVTSSARSRIGLVAGVGVTDGADNIAVYVPLFAVLEREATVVVAAVLVIAAGAWVLFARWLASRPWLADRLETYGDLLLPIVLVGLGVVILSGAM